MSGPGFLSETRERFLKAILSQLPLERVREMYLFPPIRQGGVESGVAVVAGYPEGAPAEAADAATPGASTDAEPVAPAEEAVPVCEVESAADEATASVDEVEPAAEVEVTSAAEPEAGEPEPATPPAEKYTVYTAHYRHVLKGPDRGKWEATLVAEAEAPLLSIESVVRGVQRRAGDVESPDHMTAADVRTALRLGPAHASDAA